MDKRVSYTSLILTGDTKGIEYIKETPKSFFSMCCTRDASTRNSEVNFQRHKPIRKQVKVTGPSFWSDDIIHFYLKEAKFQQSRLTQVLLEKQDAKVKPQQLQQLVQSRYQDIIIKFEDLRSQL